VHGLLRDWFQSFPDSQLHTSRLCQLPFSAIDTLLAPRLFSGLDAELRARAKTF